MSKFSEYISKNTKIFGIVFALLISIILFVNRDKFIHLQGLGLVGLFLLSVIGNATIILPMPVVLTAFVGGSLFNPLLVTLVISFGATIGELTGYLAGISGQNIIDNDPKFVKIRKWMDKYGLWTIFILAAVPNPLFDLAGIVAGAYKISVIKYLLVVFLGKIIKFGLIAFLGANSVKLIGNII